MSRSRLLLALALASLIGPTLAHAQATNVGVATKAVHLGQVQNVVIDDATNDQKWFSYRLQAGRSYCAEVASGPDASSDPDVNHDPVVTVYAVDGTTVIATNDDAGAEPGTFLGARACFVAPPGLDFRVQVIDTAAGTYDYQLRVVETTLWASWFFIGGDYNSFLLMRNTTSVPVNYTINWRSVAGAIVGTTTGTVTGNGALGLNARTFITNPGTDFNGTVEVVHDASSEGLVGQVTTLSATSGLGYDSVLAQRKVW